MLIDKNSEMVDVKKEVGNYVRQGRKVGGTIRFKNRCCEKVVLGNVSANLSLL